MMEEDSSQQPQAPQWLLDLFEQQIKQIATFADKFKQLSNQQNPFRLTAPIGPSTNISSQIPQI